MKRIAIMIGLLVLSQVLSAQELKNSFSANAQGYFVVAFGVIVVLLAIVVIAIAFNVIKTLKVLLVERSEGEREPEYNKQYDIAIARAANENNRLAKKDYSLVMQIKRAGYAALVLLLLTVVSIHFLNQDQEESIDKKQRVASAQESNDSKYQFVHSKDEVTIEKGRRVFLSNCASCHRNDGGGNQIGPNLTDEYWLHGGEADSVYYTIKSGVTNKGMPAWGKTLKFDELNAVTNFVLSLQGSKPKDAKDPQGKKLLSVRQ